MIRVILLSSTPEVGFVTEIGGIGRSGSDIMASRERTESCGIVVCGYVAYGTSYVFAVPSHSGCQRFGNIGIVDTAYILALAPNIVGELFPLRFTRHMPTIGTDALHTTGVGIAGSVIVHHRRPVVQQAVGRHIRGTVVRIVPISRGGGSIAAL